ncbi:efflux RND transporter permease subunit (plasmid) [Cereibacter sphaeroides]|uniref:efflux RND transporter permease subunit n=1 Tax=Cereibacter sphaeroides TaxID=1063 RepID=UPI000F541F32|nr:efflux RND transporter permease subunit [Cereibacter sphaeroides]AZB66352.1 efflux RND transporter permease subunit [Cereibacter sphaeroides]AZB71204.1 efflux RND transporter permease subunit [Cereibacter sphaeroides]
MFSIARASIDKSLITWVLMLGCLLGGLWGFATVGRLEDPAFSIKSVVVITEYPGASAEQVAREVSEPLESAIQQMGELENISSVNTRGMSRITVDVQSTYGPDELPQIWETLRNRVDGARGDLPQNASAPFVNDAFGDVYGLFYAVTAPGYSDSEIHEFATHIRRELLVVEGVADVVLDGLPQEAIYVEPYPSILNSLGLPLSAISGAVSTADAVNASGSVSQGGQRMPIASPAGAGTVENISTLTIGLGGEVVSLQDFATVSRERVSAPSKLIRMSGQEAFTVGVSALTTENVVDVGARVDARLAQIFEDLPYGVELQPIYQQHVVVDEASSDFLVSLALSVGIVVVVLGLFMGWRSAVVVGATLLLTVVGTLFFMAIFDINMQRISLGALIIAMGMLVDNAIVVADGMEVDMARGTSSRDAAEEVARKTQVPLLGATVIGILAFSGIGLSPDSTGEFLFSLFAVAGISLLLSWLLAVTVTPLLGHYLFKQGNADAPEPAVGRMLGAYQSLLRGALRFRWLVVAGLVATTVLCVIGFGQVKQQFFPNSNTPIFFVHYKKPQGTDLESTAADLALVEDWLAERPEVVSTATFVGGGASRFMLTYQSEDPAPSYGQLIIRARSLEDIVPLRNALQDFGAEALPGGEFRTEQLVFGPGGGTPIQARFSGADPVVLRALAEEAMEIMQTYGRDLRDIRTNWFEQELVMRPLYASERAQAAGITREDVSEVLLMNSEGLQAGLYQEGSRQIPLILRSKVWEGDRNEALLDGIVYSDPYNAYVPISQVVGGFAPQVENSVVERRDRVLTITVQSGVTTGANAANVLEQVKAPLEAMELPPGYGFEWGGEYESQQDAQGNLGKVLPVSLLAMIVTSILLFGKLRQPLLIWLLVPMAINGAAIALLATGMPFSFTALLGLLSLSGMLIKNGIVLVEEIDIVRGEGARMEDAIVRASSSRVRPVILAAATTILGMIPLLWDAFFSSMAVTIMGGLGFASILTLIAVPVFYYMFFYRERKAEAAIGS